MMAAARILPANIRAENRRLVLAPLQLVAGFFFAFRFAFTYLAFQSNPRAGSITTLVCSGLLMAAAMVYTLGDEEFSARRLVANRTLWWLAAYLAMSGVSLLWTGAESILNASGLWSGMVMEAAIVLLIVKGANVVGRVDALFKGFVVGMLCVGTVAWLGPTLPDLRIGDYEFLHPNMIGMYSALAFFLAQYLALEERIWSVACVALATTMLRTISKTSIIAFCIAEAFYVLREKQVRRKVKTQIAAVALVIMTAFGTLIESYLETYTRAGGGSEVETLTGRTAIWSTAFFMGIERPWIGHGFYSFRALIPAFDNGNFEPWHAHNEVLQEFFEYGLLGVAVTAGLYFTLLFAARSYAARTSAGGDSAARPYARLVFVVMLFAVIHGLTESVNFGLTIPLWLFAALAIALQHEPSEAI